MRSAGHHACRTARAADRAAPDIACAVGIRNARHRARSVRLSGDRSAVGRRRDCCLAGRSTPGSQRSHRRDYLGGHSPRQSPRRNSRGRPAMRCSRCTLPRTPRVTSAHALPKAVPYDHWRAFANARRGRSSRKKSACVLLNRSFTNIWINGIISFPIWPKG